VSDPFLRDGLRRLLDGVHDLPRLIARVGYQQANARDLLALARSLERLRPIGELLDGVEAGRLAALRQALPDLDDLTDLLRRALVDEPPVTTTEGGLIRDGYDPRVDELRLAMREGRRWIASLEASERERTGIKSLKVGFNKVFGYYIEVTRANRHLVPDDYERRQTLANAERYVTPALKEMEAKVLGAEERLAALEHELFCQLRDEVARRIPAIQTAAEVLAELDALASLAEVAARYDYVRPRLADDRRLRIRAGRHPVLDRTLAGRFVPNDVNLDGERERVMLITGPNMAGKSTFMRQVALIVIMAQMGSFVPAEEAEIGLVDRIFCRVGASDDLASGQSTFMVEVAETALAVHNATPRSLILLDEIGRGTSTFDGIAIARAVIEFIHDRIGARTLVSTHYHELTALAATRPGIRNYHARVAEEGDEIRFLWRIVPGGADRSYGINVARLAGLPVEIIERAKEILAELDRTARPRQLSLADLAGGNGDGGTTAASSRGSGGEGTAAREAEGSGAGDQDSRGEEDVTAKAGGPARVAAGAAADEVAAAARRWLEELASLDLLRMTPLDAMNVLYAWQRRLRRWQEQEGRLEPVRRVANPAEPDAGTPGGRREPPAAAPSPGTPAGRGDGRGVAAPSSGTAGAGSGLVTA
ncbi:MAG: DNA mismatch repair protein MutS, partial [Bacillota bacterium]